MHNNTNSAPRESALSSHIFLAIVAVFPVIVAALLTTMVNIWGPFSTVGTTTEHASISTPAGDQEIPRHYHVAGKIEQRASEQQLFVVEVTADGIYPKAPISATPGPWSLDLYTGAPGGSNLRIAVVAVNDKDSNHLFQWLQNGEKTGQYPALKEIPSLQELSAITVKVGEGS